MAYNRNDSRVIAAPFSLFTASWTDERREVTERGSEGSRSRQQAASTSQPPNLDIQLVKRCASAPLSLISWVALKLAALLYYTSCRAR